MKKYLKYTALAVILLLSAFTLNYAYTLYTDGPEEINFIEPEQPYISFSELIQQPRLKGKVIYVDFWHTGCRPCLEEFQYLPQLKKNFKSNDPIAFLYLGKDRSLPGEKYRWKKMVLNKQITGYHYFVSDEQFHNFWSETVKDTAIIRAVPHHLIIDKQGKVINYNAPRPQHNELLPLLRTLL